MAIRRYKIGCQWSDRDSKEPRPRASNEYLCPRRSTIPTGHGTMTYQWRCRATEAFNVEEFLHRGIEMSFH